MPLCARCCRHRLLPFQPNASLRLPRPCAMIGPPTLGPSPSPFLPLAVPLRSSVQSQMRNNQHLATLPSFLGFSIPLSLGPEPPPPAPHLQRNRSFHTNHHPSPTTSRLVHRQLPSNAAKTTKAPFKVSVQSVRPALDPHFRYLYRLLCPPALPIISSARPTDALVTRTSSLARYMGIPTPGTLTQITGFDPMQLGTATRMLRDEGYLSTGSDPRNGRVGARSGMSWNCAWPLYGKALDETAVSSMRLMEVLEACVAAILSQLPANSDMPLQLVLPVLPGPLGTQLGWPNIDTVLERLTSFNHTMPIVLDPHRGLDYRAVWEIKKRWPGLDLHLDCSSAHSVSVADLEQHRNEGGMNGIVVGRAAARDPLVPHELAVALGLVSGSEVDVDTVIHNYAVYADVVQYLYGYPYPIHDLLIPLAHILRGVEGKAFRSALLQPNQLHGYYHDYADATDRSTCSPLTQSESVDPSERSPGPTYHFIMSQVERARQTSAAGIVKYKFGLSRPGLRAG